MQDLQAELQQTKEEAKTRHVCAKRVKNRKNTYIKRVKNGKHACFKESEEREIRHRIEQQNIKENIMKEFKENFKQSCNSLGYVSPNYNIFISFSYMIYWGMYHISPL
jgi:ribosomal protein L35